MSSRNIWGNHWTEGLGGNNLQRATNYKQRPQTCAVLPLCNFLGQVCAWSYETWFYLSGPQGATEIWWCDPVGEIWLRFLSLCHTCDRAFFVWAEGNSCFQIKSFTLWKDVLQKGHHSKSVLGKATKKHYAAQSQGANGDYVGLFRRARRLLWM